MSKGHVTIAHLLDALFMAMSKFGSSASVFSTEPGSDDKRCVDEDFSMRFPSGEALHTRSQTEDISGQGLKHQ